jgi:uncharacterized protein (DUF58 family)
VLAHYKNYLDPVVTSKLSRLDLVAKLVVEGFITGLHKSPYHGFSVEFSEYRQYMPGDGIRYIDWKAYAKTDRYYIKEFEEETNLKAYLLVDTSNSMAYTSGPITKLKYAIHLAAALTFLMLRQRDAVGLVTFDEKITGYLPPRSMKSYLHQILMNLDRIQPGHETSISTTFHQMAEKIKRRGLIIILSDLMDDPQEIISGLKHFRYRKHELIVFHILDPFEREFLFNKEAIFKDLETGESITTEPWQIREEYQALVSAWTKNLKRQLADHRIDYVPITTSTEYGFSLLQYLQKRKRVG